MTATTVGSILRSTQAFCGQLCDKQTLRHGIAYYCPRFPRLGEVNQFREIVVNDPRRLEEAWQECETFFAAQGLQCGRWAPAEGWAGDAMRAFLADRGFRRRTYAVMALTRWPEAESPPRVRVLPARAVRRIYEQWLAARDDAASDRVRAALDRLDDPQYDMFVALAGKKPIGRCALYQVGDIARVMDLDLAPEPSADEAADALLLHVLALARRLAMRNICLQLDADDAAQRDRFERFGFEAVGTVEEFQRDPSP